MTQTMNGENALSGTGRETVDLFFNIGSARNAQERVEGLFDKALQSEPELTAAILAWARDARGGAGERETFRNLLRKLIKVDQKLATKLLKLAPTLGRFDDLRSGFNTSLEDVAVKIWADAIEEGNELAHKWVNIKKDHRLRKHMFNSWCHSLEGASSITKRSALIPRNLFSGSLLGSMLCIFTASYSK